MKKILTFILILLIFSCGNQSNQDNAYNDTLSTDELSNIKDSSTEDAEGNEPCKLLLSISKDDPGVKESLQNYINMLSEEIKSEDQIIKIFAFRKELIPKLDKIIVKFLDSNQEDYDAELEKELNIIGLQGIYTEGMYMELDISPVLKKEIERVATEEFKLKIEFENAVASSMGCEYPFDSMSDEMEVVRLGEEINTKFPGSKTVELIKEDFMRAVSCFTDFHAVVYSDREDSTYIVFGIDVDMYPAGSSRWNFQNFTEQLPGSKYTKVIKAVLDNPSVISYDKNSLIRLVVVDIESDHEEAEQKIFNYVDTGIDIPHKIIVRKGKEADYAVVYRFFSDKDKAQKALDYIKQTYENAKIITINFSGQIQ